MVVVKQGVLLLSQSGEKTRNSFFMKKEKRILKYDIRLTEEELE